MRRGKASRKFPVGTLIEIRKPGQDLLSVTEKPRTWIGLILRHVQVNNRNIVVVLSERKVHHLDQKFLSYRAKSLQRPFAKFWAQAILRARVHVNWFWAQDSLRARAVRAARATPVLSAI